MSSTVPDWEVCEAGNSDRHVKSVGINIRRKLR
jgi:hypothetical protein